MQCVFCKKDLKEYYGSVLFTVTDRKLKRLNFNLCKRCWNSAIDGMKLSCATVRLFPNYPDDKSVPLFLDPKDKLKGLYKKLNMGGD